MKCVVLIFSIICGCIFPNVSLAEEHSPGAVYSGWLESDLYKYFISIYDYKQTHGDSVSPQCFKHYSEILNKGSLDIRYAFGYFDESQGKSMGKDYSYSLDILAFNDVIDRLTKDCYLPHGHQLCGFQQAGDRISGKVVLTKTLQIHGKPILTRITMTQASATYSYQKNKSSSQEVQAFKTAQSNANFFKGITEADMVIYNGHSRNGGGPDFQPPVLRSYDLHPDYKGFYEVKREGYKKMIQALKVKQNPQMILAMFSCNTREHFANSILSVDPNLKMVLSEGETDYFNTTLASLGYLEAFLRGDCGQNLTDFARRNEKVRRGFYDYNFEK